METVIINKVKFELEVLLYDFPDVETETMTPLERDRFKHIIDDIRDYIELFNALPSKGSIIKSGNLEDIYVKYNSVDLKNKKIIISIKQK